MGNNRPGQYLPAVLEESFVNWIPLNIAVLIG